MENWAQKGFVRPRIGEITVSTSSDQVISKNIGLVYFRVLVVVATLLHKQSPYRTGLFTVLP